jgi:MFS family permease
VNAGSETAYESWRLGSLGGIALLLMLPVTLPVPVLRELVQERFGVSELLTSLFMSLNMVGALLAAPLAGALGDRYARRPDWIVGALVVDAVCFVALAADVPFGVFLAIRFVEGGVHILALSMLLGLASSCRPVAQRGSAMGIAGGGMMLGVAVGAPLGGLLGQADPLRPLYAGAAVLLACALLSRWVLRETIVAHESRPGLRDIVALIRSNMLVLAPLAFAFADRFTVGFFTTTFSLYLKRIHALDSATVGLLIAAFMLPFALLSYPAGRLSQRMSRAVLLCGGSLVYGVGVASLTWWSPAALFGVMAFCGAIAALMFVPSMLMTTELTPERARTTSLGAFNAAGSLGFIVGPLVGGWVSQSVAASSGWLEGYRAAFLVAGLSEVLLAVVAFPLLLRWERSAPGEVSPQRVAGPDP